MLFLERCEVEGQAKFLKKEGSRIFKIAEGKKL
jgi:hypothetical protein